MMKIKVLYTITDLGKGGAERFLLDLTTELEKYSNIEYKIAVCNAEIKYDEFKNHPKTVFIDYQPFSLKSKNANLKYTQLLDEFQPDIVHSNRFLGEFVTAYDVRKNIQYICHGHDNMIQMRPFSLKDIFNKQKILHLLEYRYLIKHKYRKMATYFLANSKDTYDFYKTRLPKSQQNNVRLLPLGFNYNKFYQEKTSILENKKIKLINVGSYQPKKNQTFAIDIAKVLKDRKIDFEFHLIGHGNEYENVNQKIKDLGLEDYVFQQGLQSNVEEWYKKSDIYLHTAYYEPYGLVFLEAMAAGLPIITLDGKGNKDIIENDKNGYLFFEQNTEAFADKIMEYTNNKEKYKEISSHAQQYAQQFDVSIKVKELIDFYKELVN